MGCVPSAEKGDFHAHYQLGAKVLQGEFSQVRMCRAKDSHADRSVKVADLRRQDRKQASARTVDRTLLRRAQREGRIWRKLGEHPNIVRLLDVRTSPNLYFFVTEKIEYGFLYVLERLPVLDEQTIARFMRDGLNALAYVHSHGIAHCDVQPDNFVCSERPLVLKLGGFSSAQPLPHHKTQAPLKGESGSPAFMSPEMLGTKHYDQKTDVWSIGVIAYVLLFGHFPYRGSDKTIKSLKDSIRLGKPEPNFEPWRKSKHNCAVTQEAKDFCQELLHRYPMKRVTAEEARQLPFIEGADEKLPEFETGKQTLVPMLYGALRAGAFYGYSCTDEPNDLDFLLNYQQFQYHGPIKPWTRMRSQASLLKAAVDKTHNFHSHSGEFPSELPANAYGSHSSPRHLDVDFLAAQSPFFKKGPTWDTLADFSGADYLHLPPTASHEGVPPPPPPGPPPMPTHSTDSRLFGEAEVMQRDESKKSKGGRKSGRQRPSQRGELPTTGEAATTSFDAVQMVLIEQAANVGDGSQGFVGGASQSADARGFRRSNSKNKQQDANGEAEMGASNSMGNSMSVNKFRRSGTAAAMGALAPGNLNKQGSKEMELMKDLQGELHPEDKQLARAMQKGLSSHDMSRRLDMPLEGGEEAMVPRKSKQELVEKSKDSSSWIHGFY
mmetsp:Transcript_35722/g.83635  ORF Transcript_35722/g.83635 Transcript_35722/m.83635 type:complete len:663 (+) Transcript_35722:105-2093(+)